MRTAWYKDYVSLHKDKTVSCIWTVTYVYCKHCCTCVELVRSYLPCHSTKYRLAERRYTPYTWYGRSTLRHLERPLESPGIGKRRESQEGEEDTRWMKVLATASLARRVRGYTHRVERLEAQHKRNSIGKPSSFSFAQSSKWYSWNVEACLHRCRKPW